MVPLMCGPFSQILQLLQAEYKVGCRAHTMKGAYSELGTFGIL